MSTSPADPASESVATVVVSDLQGSTALTERLDPESMRAALDRYFAVVGDVMAAHGGRIEKRIGDMMVTVFDGDVQVAALRAIQAVRAAAAALEELNEQLERSWGVRLVHRTGVATGTVESTQGTGEHRVVTGTALAVAAALEPVAPGAGALVHRSTVREVGDGATFAPMSRVTDRDGVSHDAALLVDAVPASPDSLASAAGPEVARRGDSRRHVTVVFADLRVADEAPDERPDGRRRDLLEVFELARVALEAHGGIVEKFIGDTVMAVYGLDQRREDDARRAAAAALDVQAAVARRNAALPSRPVEVRIGVNTGPVVAGDPDAGERLVTGDAVNVAARLEQTAWAGAVVVGEMTLRLLGEQADTVALEPLRLKGKSQPVPAWRLLGLDRRSGRAAGSVELPFLGRDEQLRDLREAWQECARDGVWRRVDLVGDAGTGKSRLLHELIDLLPDARVLRGACPSYGEGISFWPIVEVLRDAAGLGGDEDPDTAAAALQRLSPDPRARELLAGLLGLHDRPTALTELFWAVRRALVHLAADGPLLVVIDGLHDAQPTLHDLLQELARGQDPAPVLVVTMGRTDAANEAEAPHHRRLRLDAMDHATTLELISFATGHDALPVALRERLATASEGLPLFVEQLLRQLIDDGRLRRTDDGWVPVGRLDDWPVPPSVEALLSARVDALGPAERVVVDTASVIGREFGAAAVTALCELDRIGESIAELGRRQLVGPSTAADRLRDHRFRSPMTQEVAYGSLLKRTRAELHLAYADWLARDAASRGLDDLLGYHLERSFSLGVEVGVLDQDAIGVGRRAAGHLGASARVAFARGDMSAAANLFGRAAATVPQDPATAAELLVLGGDAAFEEGEFDESLARYDRAEQLADQAGSGRWAEQARLARATQAYLTGDGDAADAARATEVADRTAGTLAALGDPAGVARAWRLRSYVELTAGRWGAAEVAAERTLTAAREAGDVVLVHRMLPALASFAVFGPTPVPVAIERCDELLRRVGEDHRARCLVERSLAHLLAMDGRFERAAALATSTRERLAELGWNFDAALTSLDLGPIHLLADDWSAAERELRFDVEALRGMGDQNYRATLTSLLADAVRRGGDLEQADRLVDEAEELSVDDDVSAAVGWRCVRARLLVTRGDAAAALELLTAAATLLEPTDELTSQGEVLTDLALAREALGDRAGARQALGSALDRFVAKGHRVGERHAGALLATWASDGGGVDDQ